MKKNNSQKYKGYNLLFSVIVASILLAIAAFILSVSRKQFILVSSSRDSMYAIYAADSGIECAVMNKSAFSTSSAPGNINCNGVNLNNSATTWVPSGGSATSTFYIPINTGSVSSCAKVDFGINNLGTGSTLTIIESRGYNIGYDQTGGPGLVQGTCDIYGPRKVERALRVTYQ